MASIKSEEVSGEILLDMYQRMLKIRLFEDKMHELHEKGELQFTKGFVHLYAGEEAVAAGACVNLTERDYITSTHRGHGHIIAKGGDLKRVAAEILGKNTGYCKGKGGSMHIADINLGILGANGIVGAGIPHGVGAGLSIKKRGTDQVCICFFGDGATNTGIFHESLNLASIWKVPVIFVCENNCFGITVSIKKSMCITNVSERARAYGIPGITVDGMDPIRIYFAVKNAVERARKGGGPSFVECKTYRYYGHMEGDPWEDLYRTDEEKKEWKIKDPIRKLRQRMIEIRAISESEADQIEKNVEKEVEEAVKYAYASEFPPIETAEEGAYAEPI